MVFPPVEADAISLGVPKHKVVHVSMGPYHIAVLTQNSIFDKIRTDRFMSPILQVRYSLKLLFNGVNRASLKGN